MGFDGNTTNVAGDETQAREACDQLIAVLRGYEGVIVAFSGGVDSAVVAQAAWLALGDRAIAVTGVSPSLAAGELEEAKRVAAQIGIPHRMIETREFSNQAYVQNDPNRCFHCKTELYSWLVPLARDWGLVYVASGTNIDDQADYRPGLQAAEDFEVKSPLVECGVGKTQVRAIARHWGLTVAEKPATPCLSSRVAYGEAVTPERLRMIDRAELFLRERGHSELRVRYHRGDLARIELPVTDLACLADADFRESVVRSLREAGFRYVTLDLAGFQSGSLNAFVPAEALLDSFPQRSSSSPDK